MAPKTRAKRAKVTKNHVQDPSILLTLSDRTGALDVLLRAHAAAQETQCTARDFAVELIDLRAAGVPASDLRWLVSMGHVQHLLEITPPRASRRKFRVVAGLAFKDNSCFMLTQPGVELAAEQRARARPSTLSNGDSTANPALPRTPRWDPATRELWVGDVLVRRFLTQAENQVRILQTFQEQGWPPRIDDPLPPNGSSDRTRKLHDVITKLNRRQHPQLIKFRGDGTAHGVCWILV